VFIVNPLPVNWPAELMVQVAAFTISGEAGACPKVHVPASPVLKPLPVTEILVPIGAALGLMVIVGAFEVTMKGGSEISPLLPFT